MGVDLKARMPRLHQIATTHLRVMFGGDVELGALPEHVQLLWIEVASAVVGAKHAMEELGFKLLEIGDAARELDDVTGGAVTEALETAPVPPRGARH